MQKHGIIQQTPPNLVALFLDFDHANLGAQLLKLDTSQRFCQNISELPSGVDELYLNLPVLDALPNEMVHRIYVFALVVEDGVLAEDMTDLSTLSTTLPDSSFLRSPMRRASETLWHAAAVAAMYSASQEESATTFCFCDCQLTSRGRIAPLWCFCGYRRRPPCCCRCNRSAVAPPFSLRSSIRSAACQRCIGGCALQQPGAQWSVPP